MKRPPDATRGPRLRPPRSQIEVVLGLVAAADAEVLGVGQVQAFVLHRQERPGGDRQAGNERNEDAECPADPDRDAHLFQRGPRGRGLSLGLICPTIVVAVAGIFRDLEGTEDVGRAVAVSVARPAHLVVGRLLVETVHGTGTRPHAFGYDLSQRVVRCCLRVGKVYDQDHIYL